MARGERRQARSPAELHIGLHRPAAAFVSASLDQLPLKLREAAERRQKKPPVRCRGVRSGIGLELLTKVAWRLHINGEEQRGSPTAFDNGALFLTYAWRHMKHSISLALAPSTAAVQTAIFLFAFALLLSMAFGIAR